jgi:hypothetical protein
MTELDVIDSLVAGQQSPRQFCGTVFFVLRISACGAAWRASKNEFVWRDESIWLNPTMCARWRGAPVVWSHPRNGKLDTESFVNTVIGSVVRAFVRDADLMAVARIMDGDAAALLTAGNYDTSPAIVLPPDATEPITLKGGDKLLVERAPIFVDHLAICEKGVWSAKSGAPGVEN